MPPKRSRATKVDLAGIVATAESLDWALDDHHHAEPHSDAAQHHHQESGYITGTTGAAPHGSWRQSARHVHHAGPMEYNFRETEPVQLATVVPSAMQAPYLAYVGNLPHGVAADVVTKAFDGEGVCLRVVRHEQSTFAYVEFASREALQVGLWASGKIVAGRRIKVDVASDKQRQRQQLGGGRVGGDGPSGRSSAASQPTVSRGLGSRRSSESELEWMSGRQLSGVPGVTGSDGEVESACGHAVDDDGRSVATTATPLLSARDAAPTAQRRRGGAPGGALPHHANRSLNVFDLNFRDAPTAVAVGTPTPDASQRRGARPATARGGGSGGDGPSWSTANRMTAVASDRTPSGSVDAHRP